MNPSCTRLIVGLVALYIVAGSEPPLLGAEGLPPSVFSTGGLGDQVVARGLGVQWSFGAMGTLPLSCQWWHNDQPILDATNKSLTLTNLQPAQSGVYFATVTNAVGSATTPSARLTVVPGMEILRIGAITNVQSVYSLDVVGHLAFVGVDGKGGGLKIFDVQDPAGPILVGGLALGTLQQTVGVSDVVVSGGRAYLAAVDRGLQVLDVSDPTQAAVLGQFVTSGGALDLVIREPLAYVATSRGVQILDVSNPAAITAVGSYATQGSVYTVDLEGPTLYVAATADGVHVLDVSDPAVPRLLSRLPRAALAFVDTVKVRGPRAFVSGSIGPSVWDVSYAAYPLSIASASSSQDSRGMNVLDGLILDGGRWSYASSKERLAVFDSYSSTQMIPVAAASTSGTIEAIEIEDGRIYVAALKAGVEIFSFGAPTDPPLVLRPVQPISCVAGTSAELSVGAVGGARLRYQWFKDGGLLLNATNRTLRLATMTQADAGEYSVTVENELGSTPGGTAPLRLVERPRLELLGATFGDTRGPRITLGAPTGVQAWVLACSPGQPWQPLWSGRFSEAPIEFYDTTAQTSSRVYELLLGAP